MARKPIPGISLISSYRQPLMGLSILLIMAYHCFYYHGDSVMKALFQNGDIGVEMFAIMSGIGIFFSLSQNSTKEFYIKRLSRILPSFLIVIIPFVFYEYLWQGASIKYMLATVTTASTFLGNLRFWFISYITICYLASPVFFRIINKSHVKFACTLASIILASIAYSFYGNFIDNSSVWLMRFPSFILGMEFGSYIRDSRDNGAVHEMSSRQRFITIMLGVICISIIVLLRPYLDSPYLRYLTYILSAPFIMVAAAIVIKWVHLDKPLSFLGPITLELYLVHEHICMPIVSKFGLNPWFILIISTCLAILLAKAISIPASKLSAKIRYKAISHVVK